MTPCPECGEPLATLDDGATWRCRWCGFAMVVARLRVENDEVYSPPPAREGGTS